MSCSPRLWEYWGGKFHGVKMFSDSLGNAVITWQCSKLYPGATEKLMPIANSSFNTGKPENQENLSPSGCRNHTLVINAFKI